jgi:hypothetical protein
MTTTPIYEFLAKHDIAWIPININTSVVGKKVPSLPNGFDTKKWTHFKGTYTHDELTDIQTHLEECNAIAIDTRAIHQFDVDVMNDAVPEMMKELPYFTSFGKGLPHFFFKSPTKPTKDRYVFKDAPGIDLLTGSWSFCRKDAVVVNAELEMGVFDLKDQGGAKKPHRCEVIESDDKVAFYQKQIQAVVPNHSKTQVTKIKESGAIVTNGRWCANIGRAHRSNHVWFIERDKCLIQKCTDCLEYESEPYPMKEAPTDDTFGEFEKNHFKVMRPVCFVRETDTDVQLLNKTELMTMYEHLPPVSKHTSFIQAWLIKEDIRIYEKLDMLPPPLVVPADTYNLWRGFPASRMPTTGSHDLGIQHIRNLFPDERDSNWLITWLAHIIQKPGCKTGVCPVIIGGQGAGKGFLFEQMMGRIMGGYFAHTSDPEHSLFARFAENRNGKMLVNVDDCNVGAMKINADPFKSFITGERIEYEQKGKQTISLLNCANYVMTTNNENPVKLDTDDRRYAVIGCSKKLVGNVSYFEELRDYVADDANMGALWNFFMEWDTSKINLARDRPMSQLYADMKMLGADKELLYLGSLIKNTTTDFDKKAEDTFDGFRAWLNESGYGEYKKSKIGFGMYLKKIAGIESVKRSVMFYHFDIKRVSAHLLKNGVDVEGVCLL